MSGKFTIKPPTWPRELTFVEFSRLNPHIENDTQLIELYNQYLHKYLEELRQKKIHFKYSLNNHLLNELNNNNFDNTLDDFQDWLFLEEKEWVVTKTGLDWLHSFTTLDKWPKRTKLRF